MNEQAISLDVSKAVNPTQWVYMGQGDRNGTTIVASIFDNGSPLSLDDKAAQFEMLLPGGKFYVMDENCEVSGNTVTYVVDESKCCQVVGKTTVAYFDILIGTSVIASTERFSVQVLEGAHEDGTAARSYLGIVDELVEKLDEASDDYATIREEIMTATETIESAATAATDAVDSLGTLTPRAEAAATAATSAASSANAAASRANEAAAAAEASVAGCIPTMSATVKGGATLGSGLQVSGTALGVIAMTESDVTSAVAAAFSN